MIARTLGLGMALAAAWLVQAAQPASAQSLNQKVAQYARNHLGQQVGSGECSSLAYYALKAAHAKELNDFHDRPGKGDYVWGKEVAQLSPHHANVSNVKPGDVLQLRNVAFKGSGYSYSYGHHTAVVLGTNPRSHEITVAQQNVNGDKTGQKSTYDLNDMKKGWIRAYRPTAK